MKNIKTIISAIVTLVIGVILGSTLTSFYLTKSHHGNMNVRVGQPYYLLMNHMNTLAEQGRTIELYDLINKAHSNSVAMSEAWLSLKNCNEFGNFVITEIEKPIPTRGSTLR